MEKARDVAQLLKNYKKKKMKLLRQKVKTLLFMTLESQYMIKQSMNYRR